MKSIFLTLLVISSFVKAEFSGFCGYPIPDDSSNYCGTWIKYPVVIENFVECLEKEKDYYCKGDSKDKLNDIRNKCTIESVAYMGASGLDKKGEPTSATSMLIIGCVIQKLKKSEFYDCGCDL